LVNETRSIKREAIEFRLTSGFR